VNFVTDESGRIDALQKAIFTLARQWDRIRPVYKPYVEGLDTLPADGRFLLVGNHSATPAVEILLILYEVQRHLGKRVRALMDRQLGELKGVTAELVAAGGGVVGERQATAELMAANEPILVFPGGAREFAKGKDERYNLLWAERDGFARLAVQHNYPIVTAPVVGGDDVYKILTTRHGPWARLNRWASQRLNGRADMTMPLMRGIGPTALPRPQRVYARFAPPIDTTRPKNIAAEKWVATVRATVKKALESDLTALQKIRADDPFRHLVPWAWRSAVMPPETIPARSAGPCTLAPQPDRKGCA
jgi:1-acyl-sn-glycerol-3-phosphate acyltransferase